MKEKAAEGGAAGSCVDRVSTPSFGKMSVRISSFEWVDSIRTKEPILH